MANKNYITQEERDILNYRPQIEYTTDPVYTQYVEPAGTTPFTGTQGIIERVEKPSAVPLWNDLLDTLGRVNKLDQTFSTVLNGLTVTIPQDGVAGLVEAADAIGAEPYEISAISRGYLPFSAYRKALFSPDSPAKSTIIDIFEMDQSDVNGDLQAEVYPHVLEVAQDLQDLADFYRKGVFAQFMPIDQIPTSFTSNDPSFSVIQSAEQDLHDRCSQAVQTDQSLADQVRQAYLFDQDLSTAETNYQANRVTLLKLQRKLATKAEVTSMVDTKVGSLMSIISFMEGIVGFKPYQGNTYAVLYNLLRQYPTRQDLQNGLRKVQALMKLSVDRKNEMVTSLKANVRGLAGRNTKINIHKSLINGIHMKNEVAGDVLDLMNGMSGLPDSQAFDVVANHLADSVAQSLSVYEDQATDFHKIHSMDSELRRESLSSLVDKDAARDIYKLATQLLSYGSQTNTWPDKNSLSAWLVEFMNHENLT